MRSNRQKLTEHLMKLPEQQMDLQKDGQKLIDPILLRLRWVAKLVVRLLAMATNPDISQICKMSDISKVVANTL